jgi:hypothetical protein
MPMPRLYNSYADAKEAVRNLEAAGVSHNDISIIASNADNWYSSDQTGEQGTFPDRDLDGKDDRAEAAGAGAGVGAAVGGAAGLFAGLGLMAIPGVGPVVAAGWLVSTLAGAAAGAPGPSGVLFCGWEVPRLGWRCLVQRNAGIARPSAYSGQSRHLVRECEIFSLVWHAPGRGSQSKQRNGGRRTDP